jgi:uncharacterized protein DUF892
MAKKQKRGGARREPTKGTAERDIRHNSNSAKADAALTAPKEVFDSSKYNAMSDMNKGSNLATRNVEALADTQHETNTMKSERINNESITNRRTTTMSESTTSTTAARKKEEVVVVVEVEVTPKLTPMMVEERVRTIREVNEEEKEEDEDEDRHRHLSSSISAMTHQFGKEKKFVLYLNIMLSIENATIERLHARVQQSQLAEVREQLVQHLEETKEQKRRLIMLIHMLGSQPTNERAFCPAIPCPKYWKMLLRPQPLHQKSKS